MGGDKEKLSALDSSKEPEKKKKEKKEKERKRDDKCINEWFFFFLF